MVRERKTAAIISFFSTLLFLTAFSSFVYALPEGESVQAGSASFDHTDKTFTANVTSDKAIINYNKFGSAADEAIIFNQPSSSSIVLNRVVGSDPSALFGSLTANGRIFIINPNGVLFGPSSRVDAPGLLASTLNISDQDFLNNKYNFFKVDGKNGSVINQGQITITNGGYACLLSQSVQNSNTPGATAAITANTGTVILAAGEKMTLALDDLNDISVVIDEPVKQSIFGPDGFKLDSAVKNSGNITANGGKVILTAKVLNKVFDYAINNEGVIQASSIVNHNGIIELTATGAPIINTKRIEAGNVNISIADSDFINKGEIIATAVSGGVSSGNIKINALNVLQDGRISADKLIEIHANTITSSASGAGGGGGAGSSSGDLTAVLQAPQVVISAQQIGGIDVPLRIDAGLIRITRLYGDIDIVDSLITGNGVLLRGPPGGFGAILYNKDADLTLNAPSGRIALYPGATIEAKNLTLNAQSGITSLGSLLASQTLTLLSQGPISSLSILKAYTLIERGSTFNLGGISDIRFASMSNADGAANFSTGNYSGTYTDNGDINIDSSAIITLIGNTIFWADYDHNGSGHFSMKSGSSIVGQGHDLTLIASDSSTLRSITGVNSLSFMEAKAGANPTYTLNNNISLAGTLNILSGTVDASGKTVTVAGLTTISGGTYKSSTNTNAFNGGLTLSGGTFTAGSGAINTTTLTVSGGTFNCSSGTITANELDVTSGAFNGSSGDLDINGNVNLSNGTLKGTSGLFAVSGNWNQTGGTFNPNNQTVTFDGAGTQTLTSINNFHNLIHSGAGTLELNNALGVGGTFTNSSGIFNANGQPITITGLATISGGTYKSSTNTNTFNGGLTVSGGTFTGSTGTVDVNGKVVLSSGTLTAPSGIFTVSDDWTHTLGGTFDNNGGTVIFDGGSSNINVNGTETFNNLTFNSTGTKTISNNDNLIVNGTLTLQDGTVNQSTRPAAGSIAARGNIVQQPTFGGGSALLIIDGTGDQTFTGYCTNTTGDLTDLTINKSFGILYLVGTIRSLAQTAKAWTYLVGNINAGTSTVVFDKGVVIVGSHSLYSIVFRGSGVKQITAGTTLTALGTLYLTDGSLTAGTLEARGDVIVGSGFDGGNASLFFTGTAVQNFDLSGATDHFNGNITINKTGGEVDLLSNLVMNQNNQILTIQNGTFDLNGYNLSVNGTGGKLIINASGNLQLQGPEVITAKPGYPQFDLGSTVTYDGLGTYAGLNAALGYNYSNSNVIFNGGIYNLGDNLVVGRNLTILAGTLKANNKNITLSGNWTNSGIFDPGTGTVIFVDASKVSVITGSNTFNNFTCTTPGKHLTFEAGSTQTINGNFILTGAAGAGNLIVLRSTIPGSQWYINAPHPAVSYVDVQDSNNTGGSLINPANSVDSGNNLFWFGFDIDGLVYSDWGGHFISDGTSIILLINGTNKGTVVTSAGSYSFLNIYYVSGDVVLVYISSGATPGNTVTVASAADITGLNIYGNAVIVRHENAGPITNAILATAKGAADPYKIYTVTGSDLALNAGAGLIVWGGKTYTPGGNLTATDLLINSGAVYNAGASTILLDGDFTNSGIFNCGTSTVNFDKVSGTQKLTSNGSALYNLILSGDTLQLQDNLAVTNVTTLAGSTFNPNGKVVTSPAGMADISGTLLVDALTFDGNYFGFGPLSTFRAGSTVNYCALGLQTINHNMNYSNLVTSGSGTKLLDGILSADNLTVGLGTILDVAGYGVTIANIFTNLGQVTTSSNDIHITAGSMITGTILNSLLNKSIYLTTTSGDMQVDYVAATNGGNVTLNSAAGITDANGAGVNNISAVNLILNAANGINLDTTVTNLDAVNTATGDIVISNTGSLTLKDLDLDAYSVYNPNGGINIQASSPLTVTNPVYAEDDITLYAAGGATGNLTINADVQSTGGHILLAADNDIILNAGTISAAHIPGPTADIALEADYYGAPGWTANGGAFTQNGGQIGSGIETVYVTSTNDNYIINVKGNDVWLMSRWGKVYDAGTTSVTSNYLAISAATGIDLSTSVSYLFAKNGTSGNIIIDNTGSLELLDFNTPAFGYAVRNLGGGVYITASSPLTVSSDVIAAGDITLIAGNSLAVGDTLTISANITSTLPTSTITLTAGDSINHTAGTVSVTGGGTINATADNEADSAADGDPAIFIQAPGAVFNSNGGTITVNSYGDATVNLLNAGAGTVNVTSSAGSIKSAVVNGIADIVGSTINLIANLGVGTAIASPLEATATTTLNASTTFGDIFINSPTANLPVGLINAAGGLGDVYLISAAGITDANGAGVNNISAYNLTLNAVSGITLDTIVTNLDATNTSSGNIEISNNGDLNLISVINSAPAGVVDITTSNNLNVYYVKSDTVDLTSVNGNIKGKGPGVASPEIKASHLYMYALNGGIDGTIPFSYAMNARLGHTYGFSVTPIYVECADIYAVSNGYVRIYAVNVPSATFNVSSLSQAELIADNDMYIDYVKAPSVAILLSLNGSIIGLDNNNPLADIQSLTTSAFSTLWAWAPNGSIYGAYTGGHVVNALTINASKTVAFAKYDITIYNLNENGAEMEFVEAGFFGDPGDLVFECQKDLRITYAYATDLALLVSTDSSIIALNNGSDPNVEAGNLCLYAIDGIGTLINPLATKVSKLQAVNTTSGDIAISNTGNLTIDDFYLGSGWGIKNLGGTVSINSTGSIDAPGTSGSGILASGDVNLVAGTDIAAGSASWMTFIQSNAGSVLLNAGNDIYLGQFGYSDIYTDSGTGGITMIAGHNITLDNDSYIQSNTGNISIMAGNDMSMFSTGHISTGTGTIDITANGGKIVIGPSTGGVTSTSGNITLKAAGNVELGYLKTGADVSVTADSDSNGTGAIVDNNGSSTNIEANNLTLSAAQGIALDTKVNNLDAINSTSGDIAIANIGALILKDLNADGYSVHNPNGKINISASSPLTVNSDVVAGSDITLTAGNNMPTPGDALTLSANVTSTTAGSVITLNAGDSINQTAGTVSVTGGGTINATANTEGDATDGDPATFTQAAGASFNSNGGNISVSSYGDAAINLLDAGTTGTVAVTVTNGVVKNAFSGAACIIGSTLNLIGNLGIGTAFASPLEVTAYTTLNADSSVGNANIYIKSSSDIPAGLINAGAGDVYLTTTGAITDANGAGVNNVTANLLTLTAPNGIDLDTTIGTLHANTTDSDITIRETDVIIADVVDAGLGNVNITSGSDLTVGSITGTNVTLKATSGNILDDANEASHITANVADLTAVTGSIGSNVVDGDIDIDAPRVKLNAGTGIYVETANGATFDPITAGDVINILAHGSIFLGNITGTNGISIRTTAGDITFQGTVTSTNSGVEIKSDIGNVFATTPASVINIMAADNIFITVPFGTISVISGVPVRVDVQHAALVLNIGGKVGVTSGFLSGLAQNIFFIPASYPSPLYPPGNVFFNGVRIWPSFSSLMASQGASASLHGFAPPYLEQVVVYQLPGLDINGPAFTPVFFYHPLTPSDMSAFSEFNLEEGAYQYIEGNLNMVGHNNIQQLLEELKKKKKQIGL